MHKTNSIPFIKVTLFLLTFLAIFTIAIPNVNAAVSDSSRQIALTPEEEAAQRKAIEAAQNASERGAANDRAAAAAAEAREQEAQAAEANSPPKATPETSLCGGARLDVNATCTVGGVTETNRFNKIIATIVNLLTIVVGIVAVIMIIVGGFKYVTSGGDSGKVGSAKSTILYAVIGLVIVALAQFIVRFVLGKATNSNTT